MRDTGEARPASRHTRRTTFVSAEEWQAFDEFKAGIIGRKGEFAVSKVLGQAGLAVLNNVILSDSMGLTQIDHLVRGPHSIVVLETKTYAGEVTGERFGKEWTQIVSGVAHQQQNPVRQNERHCRAVEATLAGLAVAIDGYVVSAGQANFAVHLLPLVVPVGRIGETVRNANGRAPDSGSLDVAWARLTAAAEAGEDRRDEHEGAVRNHPHR